MTALEGAGLESSDFSFPFLLLFFFPSTSFSFCQCEKENKWSTVHQTLARGKQLGGSASKITSVLGSNKGGTNSAACNFFFFFIFSGWGVRVDWRWWFWRWWWGAGRFGAARRELRVLIIP